MSKRAPGRGGSEVVHRSEEEREAYESDVRKAAEDDALKDDLERHFHVPSLLLREKIDVLEVLNVFFLCNVDSYTRDDLMSMTAAKTAAILASPQLILEHTTARALVDLFRSGLQVSERVLQELRRPERDIVASRRSGQWLLVDGDYKRFREDVHKKAEPLSQIIKSLTLAHLQRRPVEEALEALATLLRPRDAADARGHFLLSLVQLSNACYRAVLGENMKHEFLQRTLEYPNFTQESGLRAEYARQGELLAETLAALTHPTPRAFSAEVLARHRELILEATKELLYQRLKLLCMLNLQLVNLSGYTLTGHALKLAFMIAPLKSSDFSLYWLVCFQRALTSLGYTPERLLACRRLWKTSDELAPLTGEGDVDVENAKAVFDKLRAIYATVGPSPDTKCLVHLLSNWPLPLVASFRSFLVAFLHGSAGQEPVKDLELSKEELRGCNERMNRESSDSEALAEVIFAEARARHAASSESQKQFLSVSEISTTLSGVTSFYMEL